MSVLWLSGTLMAQSPRPGPAWGPTWETLVGLTGFEPVATAVHREGVELAEWASDAKIPFASETVSGQEALCRVTR